MNASTEIDRQVAVDDDSAALLPAQADLEAWVGVVLAIHPDEARCELTIRFVEPDESQALNRDYRHKDKPTNVLSFPFEAPPGLELPLLGDLVICHAVVSREAHEQGKPLLHHYAHMVIHGCLHLLGYDHIDDEEAEEMETVERELLETLGIADPYAPDD
ncbi:rRNA maturation RNase YbeY [Halomonas shantousis]